MGWKGEGEKDLGKYTYIYIIAKTLYMTEEFNSQDYSINPDDFNKFVSTLKEEEKNEIDRIITRYFSYEPVMVEAALHVAVDKGLIFFDLKERLLSQVRMNFSEKAKDAKRINWERYNAFTGYVAKYTDDELLNLIEDPADIVIDVYHAVLVTAKERSLITGEDFDMFYKDVLKSSVSSADLMQDDLQEFHEYIGNNAEDEADDDEKDEEYEKLTTEINEFRERSGSRLLLRGGVSLTIAGIMMLAVYVKLLFDGEFTEIIVLIVALGALGLGILLLWLFKQSRNSKDNQ